MKKAQTGQKEINYYLGQQILETRKTGLLKEKMAILPTLPPI